ncbi:GIY-YIG nuclease family protein [Fredinandcohnia onubensis]|uniref:GIY-YIG nuclease family protein n=1 Tax=Fredinandcohnia onubensis TaxID=1571209 RepID=UPI000C0BEDC2|nr:GIY-YIG nuclease family protein [Fredinandcohnia onubensis]
MGKKTNIPQEFPVKTSSLITNRNKFKRENESKREIFYQWQTEIFPTYQGVYFIYNKLDQLLYVGKGKKVKDRLDKHCTDFDSHINDFYEHFYRVETIPVPTGDLDVLFFEILYINQFHPIFNKKDVLFTNPKKRKARKSDYLDNVDPIVINRTSAEDTIMGLGFPPEDGHLYNLWMDVQDLAGNSHSYYSSSGMKASLKVIDQWVEREKPQFLENIMHCYGLPSTETVEQQLKDYVRFDNKNIFSMSSVGWDAKRMSLYY